jgi:anti-sigma regulatory factor (Ser/Thr protein kinase)
MNDDGNAAEVRLIIPGTSRFVATVRAVAVALGVEAGFDMDAIDDLRIGINEAVALAIGKPNPRGAISNLLVSFETAAHEVSMTVQREDGGPVDSADLMAQRILDTVVDRYSVEGAVITLSKSASDGRAR